MVDQQVLSAQRRNVMILSSVVILIAITNTKIIDFKVFEIDFEIAKNATFFTDFNTIIFIGLVYSIFRYLVTYREKNVYEVTLALQKDFINDPEFKEFVQSYEKEHNSVVVSVRLSKHLRQYFELLLSSKNFDLVVPFLYTILAIITSDFIDVGYRTSLILIMLIGISIIISDTSRVKKDNYLEARYKHIKNIK